MPARVQNATIDRLGYIARTYTRPQPVHIAMLAALEAAGFHQGDGGPTGDLNTVLTAWFWRPRMDADLPDERHWEILTEALATIRPALGSTPVDRYLPWVAQQVNQMLKEGRYWRDTYEISMKLVRSLRAIAEWAHAEGVDLNTVDAETALDQAVEHEEDIDAREVEQGRVVMSFADGYTIQVLDTDEQLEDEGDAMQHCVGQYSATDGDVLDTSGDPVEIYSLRDEKGRPHATIELDAPTKSFTQIRGKQNVDPVERYWPYLGAFIEERGLGDADAPDFVLSAFQEAYEYTRKVEADAEDANALMKSAADRFEKREFEYAREDAENATLLEGEYGDASYSHHVLSAVDRETETIWKAGAAEAKKIPSLTQQEHDDLEEAFDDASHYELFDDATEIWKSDDPRLRPVTQALDAAHAEAAKNVDEVSEQQQGMWTGLDWTEGDMVEEDTWYGPENHGGISLTYDSSTFDGVEWEGLEALARDFARDKGILPIQGEITKYVKAARAAPAYRIAA